MKPPAFNPFALSPKFRQNDVEMNVVGHSLDGGGSAEDAGQGNSKNRKDREFLELVEKAFPSSRTAFKQKSKKTKIGALAGLVAGAAIGSTFYLSLRSMRNKEVAAYDQAKASYCHQYESYPWIQPMTGSNSSFTMQNVYANLEGDCILKFGTKQLVYNPNPLFDDNSYPAGPFPQDSDSYEIHYQVVNYTHTALSSQNIQTAGAFNMTSAHNATSSQIQGYCDQFKNFTWIQSQDKETTRYSSLDSAINVKQDLSAFCVENFGTTKTIDNPIPFLGSSTRAGPFPITFQRIGPVSYGRGGHQIDSELTSYRFVERNTESTIGRFNVSLFSGTAPKVTPLILQIGSGGTAAAAAILSFIAAAWLRGASDRRVNKKAKDDFKKSIEQQDLFGTEIKTVEQYFAEQQKELVPATNNSKAIFDSIVSSVIASPRSDRKEEDYRTDIWTSVANDLAMDHVSLWVNQKLNANELTKMSEQFGAFGAQVQRGLSLQSKELSDFQAWAPNHEHLKIFETLLSGNYDINKEAASVLRKMAYLAAPALQLRQSQQRTLEPSDRVVYRNLFEKAQALLPNVKTPFKYHALYFGATPSFAVITAHGDENIDPRTSLGLTTETLQGGFVEAWRADGNKVGSNTMEMIGRLKEEGCSEAKVMAIAEWLANRTLNMDAISRVDEVWDGVSKGDKTKTDVMNEHVRHLYVQAWQRYAADHGLARELTEALAQQMQADPKWEQEYFSEAILRQTLGLQQQKITQEAPEEFERLIEEQKTFGTL